MTSPLKPCPFCGSVEGDRVAVLPDLDGWVAGCTDGCRIQFHRHTRSEAVAAWNRREADHVVLSREDWETISDVLNSIVQDAGGALHLLRHAEGGSDDE